MLVFVARCSISWPVLRIRRRRGGGGGQRCVEYYQYPSLWIFSVPMTAISADAPPGGCNVPVASMITMDNATARLGPNQGRCTQSIKCLMVTPTAALNILPWDGRHRSKQILSAEACLGKMQCRFAAAHSIVAGSQRTENYIEWSRER